MKLKKIALHLEDGVGYYDHTASIFEKHELLNLRTLYITQKYLPSPTENATRNIFSLLRNDQCASIIVTQDKKNPYATLQIVAEVKISQMLWWQN